MNIEDLGHYDPDEPGKEDDWVPVDPKDVVYMEIHMRVLVPRHLEHQRPMTLEEWVRFHMAEAIDVRVNRLGPGIDVTVCERGHVMPEDEVKWVEEQDVGDDEPPIPAHQECDDCIDEAVAAAERRAEEGRS